MKMTRAYAPGGGERDTDGVVMHEKTDLASHLFGTGVKPVLPLTAGEIKAMIVDHFAFYDRLPTKLYHSGHKSGTTSIGYIIKDIGFVSLDLIPDQKKTYLA